MVEKIREIEKAVELKNKVSVKLKENSNEEIEMDILQGAVMMGDIIMAAKRVRRMTDCTVVKVKQNGEYIFDLFRSGAVSRTKEIKMY